MKVLVTKQSLESLSSAGKLEGPLNLYGLIRETEKLSYVVHIGAECSYLNPIGQIANSDEWPEGERLIATLNKGRLTFHYQQAGKWEKVKHQIIDLNDSFKRTPYPQNLRDVLKNSTVAKIGVGSVGSSLVVGMARAGVGRFKLADSDTFAIENVSRHEGDLLDIGRYKVDVVKEKILRVNPNAKVDTYPVDVFKEDESVLEEFFKDIDLAIATTDRTSVQLTVNYECHQRTIPALFVGCYESARAGEILYTIPGVTSFCYECLRGGIKQPERLREIDYSSAQSIEEYVGEPGLNAAIDFVTSVGQFYAIALLLRNEDCEMAKLIKAEKNLLLIGGALAHGYYFFKSPFHFIRPKLKGPWKECETCQP